MNTPGEQAETADMAAARASVRAVIERAAVSVFGATTLGEPVEGSAVPARTGLDDPLVGVRAARLVADLATARLREYALAARATGRSWDDAAKALGLPATPDPDDGGPDGDLEDGAVGARSQAAFEWLVEGRAPARDPEPFAWGGTAVWTCADCRARVRDRGPFASHPEDREQGHATGCARQRAAIAAWRHEHDPDEQDEQDEQDEGEQDEQDEQDEDDEGEQGRERDDGCPDGGRGGGRR